MTDSPRTAPPLRRVAVTGGAGFIGSHLVEALLGGGTRVTVIDNFSPYYEGKEANLSASADEDHLEVVRLDVLDTAALERGLRGVEVVFHLAAQPGVRYSFEHRENTRSINVDGTRSVLDASRSAGVRRVVFASSSSVYGLIQKLPVSENHAVQPISPYGESKARAEDLLHGYGASGDLEVVSLRLFSVYGPRQRPDMAGTRFLGRLTSSSAPLVTGDGMQTRDFTFVGDAVAAFLAAGTTVSGLGETFNVGTGIETPLKQFLSLLVEFLGLEDSAVEHTETGRGEPGRMRCDSSKATRVLGWRPRVDLREGVERQVHWWVTERVAAGRRS